MEKERREHLITDNAQDKHQNKEETDFADKHKAKLILHPCAAACGFSQSAATPREIKGKP